MKKVLSLVLCFVLVAVMALPALAASYTVDPANGNASYENAYGYVFNIDAFNNTSVAEKNVIFDNASGMGEWWQFVALEKVEGDTYVAVTDSALWKNRAADFALEEGQIILVCHSSSSKPPEEAKKFPEFATYFETDGTYKYPNWQNKIALMAVKAGDYLTFSGVDFAAGTVAADATATCTAENPAKPADKVINLLAGTVECNNLTYEANGETVNDNIVYTLDENGFNVSHTAGQWPYATLLFDSLVTVPVEGTYVELEATVTGAGYGAAIRLLGPIDDTSVAASDAIYLHQFDEDVAIDGSGDAPIGSVISFKLPLSELAYCNYVAEEGYAGKIPFTTDELSFKGLRVVVSGAGAECTVTKLNLIVPAEGGEEEVVTENKKVSDGASYTTSQLFRQNNSTWSWDETCEIAYPDSGNELFDGVFPPAEDHELYDSNAGAWMGFHSQCPDYMENGYAWIKIDLGKSYDLTDVVLYTASSLISSATASNIKVLVSEDGETWADFGAVDSADDTSVTVIKNTVTGSASGRYVEIRMTAAGHWLGVCEAEVFADVVVSGGSTTKPEEEADTSLMGDAPTASFFTATVSGPEAWKAGDKVTIDVTIEVTEDELALSQIMFNLFYDEADLEFVAGEELGAVNVTTGADSWKGEDSMLTASTDGAYGKLEVGLASVEEEDALVKGDKIVVSFEFTVKEDAEGLINFQLSNEELVGYTYDDPATPIAGTGSSLAIAPAGDDLGDAGIYAIAALAIVALIGTAVVIKRRA